MGTPIWSDWSLRYWWNEEKARHPETSRVKPPPCSKTGLLATVDGLYPRTVLHRGAEVATFHIYRDTANQYRWRLRTDNGRIVGARFFSPNRARLPR